MDVYIITLTTTYIIVGGSFTSTMYHFNNLYCSLLLHTIIIQLSPMHVTIHHYCTGSGMRMQYACPPKHAGMRAMHAGMRAILGGAS